MQKVLPSAQSGRVPLAGDKVTFSATETGGIKTITNLQKQ